MILFCILLVAILVGFSILVVFYFDENSSENPRIKFEEFQKWYSIAPEKWDTSSCYVEKKIKGYGLCSRVKVSFSFFDWVQYLLWYKANEKTEENRKRDIVRELVLKSVQEDIDNSQIHNDIKQL